MTRILVGALSHESNSFSPILTERSDFVISPEEELLNSMPDCPALRGIWTTLAESNIEIVPALYARARPGGLVAATLFEELCQLLTASVTPEIDGACFYLHGSMRAVGADYCDLEFLRILRKKLGPGKPIAIAFDMHANLVPEIAELVNIAVSFRTAPHVDETATGARVANLLLRTLRGEINPVTGIAVAPWVLPGEQAETAVAPLSEIMATLALAERQDGLLAASFTNGHPWCDIPRINVAITTVANDNRDLAFTTATDLLQQAWQQRASFRFFGEALPPAEAVTQAIQSDQGPLFISDSGDNPDAGGTTGETVLLRELLSAKAKNTLFVALLAPEACHRCRQAGTGASVSVEIEDTLSGPPLKLVGTVLRVGNFTSAANDASRNCPTAVLRHGGTDIVLTTKRASLLDPVQLHSLQLDVREYQIVALKRGYLTPELSAASQRSILALTQGATDCLLERLPYHRLVRPIWPFDRDTACP